MGRHASPSFPRVCGQRLRLRMHAPPLQWWAAVTQSVLVDGAAVMGLGEKTVRRSGSHQQTVAIWLVGELAGELG